MGPVNLFLQALFSTTEVTLQNKAIMTCNYSAYRAYILSLLNYGQDADSSQGWILDDADSPGVSDSSGTNKGLFLRGMTIQNSKTVDFQEPIFHDLFSMEHYFFNQVDVKVKMYRNPIIFALIAENDKVEDKIDIQDIYILAKKKSLGEPGSHLRTRSDP